MNHSKFFTEGKLGPLLLRNRSIRAAAFEGMSEQHNVTEALVNYHTAVAKGGVGMSTVAYASVSKSGLSFPHQLWMRKEIVGDLKKLTDSVHREGSGCVSTDWSLREYGKWRGHRRSTDCTQWRY